MNDTKRTREALGISHTELANLLGVHPTTVYRWESGKDGPHGRWHRTMLEAFRLAAKGRPGLGRQAIALLDAHGIGIALFVLLRAAYGPDLARSDLSRNLELLRQCDYTAAKAGDRRDWDGVNAATVRKARRKSPGKG